MTGFGSAEGKVAGGRLRVEIRTVNHRYFNSQIKLPYDLAALEGEVRERLREPCAVQEPQRRQSGEREQDHHEGRPQYQI